MLSNNRHKIRTLVETAQDLPAMPQVWLKIRELTQQLDVSAKTIADVILKDQGLTTRLLKVANSATYASYNQKVTTVTNAIVLLGFNEVRNVVVGYAVYNMLEKLKKNRSFQFKEFWLHSLATGVATRMIAEHIQFKNPEEAFVAGLLHDVGKLVVSQLLPQEYSDIILRVQNGVAPLRAEKDILQVDHQTVGKWVAERWHFPDVLIQAISLHHREGLGNRQKSQFRIVDMIFVANEMAKIIFSAKDGDRKKDAQTCQMDALALLGLSKDRWTHIIKNLATKVRETLDEYNLEETDLDDFTQFLEDANTDQIQTENLYKEMNRELNEKVKELSVLNDFSMNLLQIDNPDSVRKLLVESIYRGIAFSRVLFFAPDGRSELKVIDGYGADFEKTLKAQNLKIRDGGAIVRSFTDQKVINVLNAASHLFSDIVSQPELDLLRCASFACVPLGAGDRGLGVIVVDNHISSEPVADQRLSAVVTFCNQASLVLKRWV